MKSDKLYFDLDTIRYEGFKKDLLFKEFSAKFWQIFRIFGEFLEFSALLLLLRTLVHGFSEFSGNFLNFQRIFDKKRQKNHWY